MEQEDVKISGEFHEVYDAAVKLWADLDIAIRGSAEDNGVSSMQRLQWSDVWHA